MGNISDVLTHGEDDAELRIGFKVTTEHMFSYIGRRRSVFGPSAPLPTGPLEYIVRLAKDGIRTVFKGIEISFDDQLIKVSWTKEGIVTEVVVNGFSHPLDGQIYSVNTKSLFPEIIRVLDRHDVARTSRTPIFYQPLRDAIANILHGRTSSEKVDYYARTFTYLPRSIARASLRHFPNVVIKKLTEASSRWISDVSLVNSLPEIIEFLDSTISSLFVSSAYIGPSRASGTRFDRIQELAVNRLDSSGSNTAMYIYSLDQAERESFNELLVRACGHTLEVEDSGPGHVSLKIGRLGQTHYENIADVGFGFSQIVPVVAQLHAVRERSADHPLYSTEDVLFAVEQPELHLHPAMQANLADLFVGAIKTKSPKVSSTSIVVETHSETLIGQLGLLVAQGDISQDEIAVYFVSKDDETGESKLKSVEFDADGVIGEWPTGFFSAL